MKLFEIFDKSKQELKNAQKIADKVDLLADEYSKLTDDELKNKTVLFKERLAKGETLDDIEVEAFATVREAAKRTIGQYPYKVQIMGAHVLHGGNVSEQATGSGKTLTATMPTYLNALSGKGVHVITVNEYLSERDAEWMGQIYRFLGLTVGLNQARIPYYAKQEAYNCDITYTTNSEIGFDYLRDNMVPSKERRVLRGLNFALIDEADSILIDDARTPLIISGQARKTASLYITANNFVKSLKDEDYSIDIKDKNCILTEEGIAKAEKFYKLDNLYEQSNEELVHYIHQALKANYLFKKDIDYLVEDGEIFIIDPNTGRKMEGREWSDGLHQAVQAKENVPIKQETITTATITYQNFFRLYNKLAGMTGTAKTEEEEFLSIYNMRVVEIPTNEPVIRIDEPDLIFGTKNAKYNALADKVEELHKKGQPVLVGTIAVETSEVISKILERRGIPHEVLNAKNHAREAEIISHAGEKGAVTIATNMAGRGTDIKLGEGVKELGGLAVLGSERHESRRIDNQLRGRSGRQGDPGFSQFYVSLQDDLMLRFGNDSLRTMFESLGDTPIQNKTVSKALSSAQKRVEGLNFDVRKAIMDYDTVLSQQRETIYQQRDFILENENVRPILEGMFKKICDDAIDYNIISEKSDTLNIEGVVSSIKQAGYDLNPDLIKNATPTQAKEICFNNMYGSYRKKVDPIPTDILSLEKSIILKTIDRAWMNQIDQMTQLRNGIGLRAYAQGNPLLAYKEEAYEMFEEMMNLISVEVVSFLNNLTVEVKPIEENVQQEKTEKEDISKNETTK